MPRRMTQRAERVASGMTARAFSRTASMSGRSSSSGASSRRAISVSSANVVRPPPRSVFVLFVLVRLPFEDGGVLPDQPAPLVRLAEQVERGERLHGVALKPQDLG